mgnify:CR=1 FL=1
MNYAIFVSGNGGFSKVLYKNRHLIPNGVLSLIIADRDCLAYKYFKSNTTIPTYLHEYNNYNNKMMFEETIYERLQKHKIDYIFLNYNKLIGPTLLNKYTNNIFNLHLSLLPLFKGFGSLEKAFHSDMLFYGASMHIVDQSIDGGPIIGQVCLPRDIVDDEKEFKNKIFKYTAVFFIDMIYKIINIGLTFKEDRVYFENVTYGTGLINPQLIMDINKIQF